MGEMIPADSMQMIGVLLKSLSGARFFAFRYLMTETDELQK